MNWPTEQQIIKMALEKCEKHEGMVFYEDLVVEIRKIKDAIKWLKEL